MSIYISNFGAGTTEQEIRELFAPYGEIRNIELSTMQGKNYLPDCALIELEHTETEDKVIKELAGAKLGNFHINVRNASLYDQFSLQPELYISIEIASIHAEYMIIQSNKSLMTAYLKKISNNHRQNLFPSKILLYRSNRHWLSNFQNHPVAQALSTKLGLHF